MRPFSNLISLVPVAALAALSLTLFSCTREEKTVDTVIPEISLPKSSVESKAGSQFIGVTAGKAWTLEIVYEGEQSGWAELNPTSGNGPVSNVKFRYSQNDDTANPRSLKIILKSAAGKAEASFTQYYKGWSNVGGYGAKIATQGWLELPSTESEDGKEFFTHYMTVGSREMRNFSYYYSYSDFDAVWVAYPLNTSLIGSYLGRTDAWAYDPLLPQSCQQNVISTYGTGYTRGHQIPSADRQGTTSRNAATFYATNMTPQDYDFNSGIWAALEGSVRTLAKLSDTLYVVTGAVLGSRKTRDRDGHSITVPDAYFKALLFYGSGYGRINKYSAAGIYMPHESTLSGSPGDFAMSIDELERKTGIQFFVNLPKKVGDETTNKLKAQAPDWLPSSWY